MQIFFRFLATIAILGIIMLGSCKDNDPISHDSHDATRIEGNWVDLTGTLSPDWHYSFDRGLLTMQYEKAGATITTLTYPYATRHDSVFIGGDATNTPQIWTLEFECDEVVKVNRVGALISQEFWLKRE